MISLKNTLEAVGSTIEHFGHFLNGHYIELAVDGTNYDFGVTFTPTTTICEVIALYTQPTTLNSFTTTNCTVQHSMYAGSSSCSIMHPFRLATTPNVENTISINITSTARGYQKRGIILAFQYHL